MDEVDSRRFFPRHYLTSSEMVWCGVADVPVGDSQDKFKLGPAAVGDRRSAFGVRFSSSSSNSL